ncbi:MarR family transcriptional regulator [Actinomadura sp. NAK00032]|uniref:MarR family transcriptional regulator n=1 Tax=Actinomadura sp. NAK00032 TaxID=2742128 RepID=UPI0015921512|nr:MarR family transcriptional regulator [Actinomadura sp. NAK00032]QKW32675.1 MarR family transcriptional regulator [Actinomadura sp. NAK00032]
MAMVGGRLARERALSACLFGNRYRWELLAALAHAPDGRVNLGLLAAENGVQAAVYYSTVRELVSAGLLTRLEAASGDRRRWYGRSGAERMWRSVGELTAGLHEHLADQSADQSDAEGAG